MQYTRMFWGLLAILMVSPASILAQSSQKFTLSDLFDSRKFTPDFFEGGRWSGQGPEISYIETDAKGATHVVRYNLQTDAKTTLIDGGRLKAPDTGKNILVEDYAFDAAGKMALLFTESEPVWRYNTKGYYYILDLESGKIKALSDRKKGFQMFAKISPDGHKAAFVRNRNLFVVNLKTGAETMFTRDGAEGKIINGTFDWVYEEEFGLRDGWSFSPDGQYIAWFKLDESAEQMFTMQDLRGLYPTPTSFRYPKAGTPNAEVQVCVQKITSKLPKCFETNTWRKGGDTHEYLARMGWTPKINGQYQVYMFRLNRDQNVLDLLYGNPATGAVSTILTETEKTWVDVESEAWANSRTDKLTFLKNGTQFIWRSENDGWRHLYLYQNDGKLVRKLTEGDWEVSSFAGLDELNNVLYVTGTKDANTERHLYRIPLSGGAVVKLTKEAGSHTVDISTDNQYFIDTYSGFYQPPTVALKNMEGQVLKILVSNQGLRDQLAKYSLPTPEFLTIPGEDGTPLNAFVLKPTNFDPTKKYPVLLHVYGGPGSQEVKNEWGGTERLWHTMLVEQEGYIMVSVDNRGTGGRGKAFLGTIYKKLGQLEAADQIAAAQWLAKQPYVDAARIGIWGWSYGGFMTLMSLCSKGGEVFKTGISVAPVGDWRQYDTIYTERYMSTPQKNATGYDVSPVGLAGNLHPHQKLLIVHGDADDNVHLQNTIQVVDALQRHLKQFDMMIYPGKNHGISGGKTRLHLYTMFTAYLKENL